MKKESNWIDVRSETVSGDGFITLSHTTDEALLKLNGEVLQKVARIVYQHTIGRSKKYDSISLSQFMAESGGSKRSVLYCIKKLEKMKVILIRRQHRQLSTYSFNLSVDEWELHPKEEEGLGAIAPKIDESLGAITSPLGAITSPLGAIDDTFRCNPLHPTNNVITNNIIIRETTPEAGETASPLESTNSQVSELTEKERVIEMTETKKAFLKKYLSEMYGDDPYPPCMGKFFDPEDQDCTHECQEFQATCAKLTKLEVK